MKSIFLLLVLISSLPAFALKITPEERYKIVKKHFDDAVREKIKQLPSSLTESRTIPVHLKTGADRILSVSEETVSDGSEPESELHAAINPADSTNIIVSSMRQNTSSFSELLTFPIYYTKNFGNTWQQSSFIGDSPITGLTRLGGGDPMFVYDLDGKNLYYTWIDMSINGFSFDTAFANIWLARSTDGGKTFSAPASTKLASGLIVNFLSAGQSGKMIDKEWLTIDRSNSAHRGTIYGSFLTINIADTSESFSVTRLLPGTTNFLQTASQIPTKDLLFIQIATLDVDNSGNVHMTFMGSPDHKVFYIFHSVSTDGGLTFSVPNIISRAEFAYRSYTSRNSYVPGIDSNRQFPSLQVACGRPGTANANDIYCIWEALGIANRTSSGDDIYFSRSTDNGTSWSTAIIINNDMPGQNRHQFRPSIFVNNKGVITAGWYDGRDADENTAVNYYVANSFDGGRSFSGETKISAQPTDFSTIGELNLSFGVGEYLQILASDHYNIPIWADGRTDDGDLKIISAFSPIAGAPSGVERRQDITTNASVVPNPAHDRLTVAFELQKLSDVRVVLINMVGEKVISAAQGFLGEGIHTVTVPLTNISSGSYILRLQTGNGFTDKAVKIVR